MKISKKKIIISLLITLLPMIIGLLLWNRLPAQIATHFDSHNQPNGWSSKAFAVFGIPAILTALQGICLIVTKTDPKNQNISFKAFDIVIWIIPATSILVLVSCYGYALGLDLDIASIASIFVGIVFLVLGNIIPKNKTNYTYGFRCPWTLNDPENWNYTNRIAGYCLVIAGILIITVSLIGKHIFLFPIVFIAVMIPYVMSYIYYRKHKDDEKN